jgi:hypothetical protein
VASAAARRRRGQVLLGPVQVAGGESHLAKRAQHERHAELVL